MSKSVSTVLLAGTTALAACGGGGGGGGGPTVEFTPTKESIGQLGVVTAEGAVVSALVDMTEDNHFSVQEIVKAFKFVEKYPDLDTSKLLNYTIKIDGVEQSLATAWNELKGYKALFYDDRKDWWQDLAQNGVLDTEDQQLSDITALSLATTKEQRRKIGSGELDKDQLLVDIGYKVTETGRTTEERVHTTSSDEVDTATSYAQSTGTVDGYTVYYNTPTTTTTTVTTTVTTKTPIVTITWSDGSTTTETADSTTTTVVGDPVVVTTVGDAQEIYREKTENVSSTSTTDDGGVAQEAVVTTTHVDETTSVIDENGNETFTTVRTYTDTTTVDTITTTTTIITVIPTTTRIENGVTTVTEAASTVTTSQTSETTTETTTATRSEIVNTWTVEAEIVETDRTTENTVTTNEETTVESTPVTVTTYVDIEDNGVEQENGSTVYTTTRTYTDTTTTTTVTTTVTTTNTTPVTTITYSNGTTETITGETVVTTSTETASNDVVTTATRTEVVDTRTVVDNIVSQTTYVDNLVYSHLDTTYLSPVVSYEDVVTYEGTWVITTRVTTTTVPEVHEHFDKKETIQRTEYRNGDVELAVLSTEYFSRGAVNKPGVTTVTETELSRVQTDDGVIGDDHEDMGTRTPGYNSNASFYETDEYSYIANRQLSVSNFSTAYSRGWTGNGSTVVIADTGAMTTHTDLDDNIKHTKDYTNAGIATSSEHGTHVAGIAGAERNGSGMHGAAFDVDLAIAKVGTGTSYSFARAKQAAQWGQTIDSVAINVSAEMAHDTAMRNSIVDDGDGMWHSNHWYYGTNGYNGSVNEATSWKTALGDEQVLVKAAGNRGQDYSGGMNQMATATDANGNLILDGQMLIVGNWDSNNNKLNSSSNKAGTICATFSGNACQDAAKIKDYYIMADGTNVTSTYTNGGYASMTGTSMAAPVVTGSIAVLHQMWPHMKGKHLVQLVLVTANENIPNYDENVHGQGLLDMDRATRPVGATGIPTTGRTNGGVSAISGGASVSGVSASQMQALTSVMVLDSFERDFYIDLGDMAQSVDTRTASVAEQMGAVNYFAPYFDSTQSAVVPIELNNSANIEVGFGTSEGHALGNSFSGTLGTTKDSTTVYANYNYVNGGFYAQAGLGVTNVEFDKTTSMLASADKVISSTATVGYNISDNWGIAVSQPVTIESAKMNYNVPVARTLDGAVQTELRTVDFKNADREIDLGTYYTFDVGPAKIDTFAEIRTGVAALKNAIEGRVGLNLKMEF